MFVLSVISRISFKLFLDFTSHLLELENNFNPKGNMLLMINDVCEEKRNVFLYLPFESLNCDVMQLI